MRMLIRFKGGREEDVLTSSRGVHCYASRAGVCKRIKRKYNRKIRRMMKLKGDERC